jgi:hypothetical protein
MNLVCSEPPIRDHLDIQGLLQSLLPSLRRSLRGWPRFLPETVLVGGGFDGLSPVYLHPGFVTIDLAISDFHQLHELPGTSAN